MQNTSKEYDAIVSSCRDLFSKKMKDYGCAWRILRLPSLTDQIFIKAQRIRGLQQNKTQRVDEGAASEFIGIINYCVMALIQIDRGVVEQPDLSFAETMASVLLPPNVLKGISPKTNFKVRSTIWCTVLIAGCLAQP